MSVARSRSHRGAGEFCGENTDGTTRFERRGEPSARQAGHGDRPLSLFVPAALEAPRVGAARNRSRRKSRVPGCGRNRRRAVTKRSAETGPPALPTGPWRRNPGRSRVDPGSDPGGPAGRWPRRPGASDRGSIWLRWAARAAAFATRLRSTDPVRINPSGTRVPSPGGPVPRPERELQQPAARWRRQPAGRPLRRRHDRHAGRVARVPPANTHRRRPGRVAAPSAAIAVVNDTVDHRTDLAGQRIHGRPEPAVSEIQLNHHRLRGEPVDRRQHLGPPDRRECPGRRVGDCGCEASPVVATTTVTGTPRRAAVAIRPPAPSDSSSGCAATTISRRRPTRSSTARRCRSARSPTILVRRCRHRR